MRGLFRAAPGLAGAAAWRRPLYGASLTASWTPPASSPVPPPPSPPSSKPAAPFGISSAAGFRPGSDDSHKGVSLPPTGSARATPGPRPGASQGWAAGRRIRTTATGEEDEEALSLGGGELPGGRSASWLPSVLRDFLGGAPGTSLLEKTPFARYYSWWRSRTSHTLEAHDAAPRPQMEENSLFPMRFPFPRRDLPQLKSRRRRRWRQRSRAEDYAGMMVAWGNFVTLGCRPTRPGT